MFDNRQYETLLQWIANYDKFIARSPIESNQRRTAQATRDELQSVLDRLTAHANLPASLHSAGVAAGRDQKL